MDYTDEQLKRNSYSHYKSGILSSKPHFGHSSSFVTNEFSPIYRELATDVAYFGVPQSGYYENLRRFQMQGSYPYEYYASLERRKLSWCYVVILILIVIIIYILFRMKQKSG
jgi:hypothetical protein